MQIIISDEKFADLKDDLDGLSFDDLGFGELSYYTVYGAFIKAAADGNCSARELARHLQNDHLEDDDESRMLLRLLAERIYNVNSAPRLITYLTRQFSGSGCARIEVADNSIIAYV